MGRGWSSSRSASPRRRPAETARSGWRLTALAGAPLPRVAGSRRFHQTAATWSTSDPPRPATACTCARWTAALSVNSEPATGSMAITYPRFSPDGRSIAFSDEPFHFARRGSTSGAAAAGRAAATSRARHARQSIPGIAVGAGSPTPGAAARSSAWRSRRSPMRGVAGGEQRRRSLARPGDLTVSATPRSRRSVASARWTGGVAATLRATRCAGVRRRARRRDGAGGVVHRPGGPADRQLDQPVGQLKVTSARSMSPWSASGRTRPSPSPSRGLIRGVSWRLAARSGCERARAAVGMAPAASDSNGRSRTKAPRHDSRRRALGPGYRPRCQGVACW